MTTEISEIKSKVSKQEWQQQILDCQSSGMNVKTWCRENRISTGSYYFHLRKIRESVLEENRIVSLEPPKPVASSGIRIESGAITITEVEDKTCDKCGSEMTVIGKEKIRDELVYVPARLFLRRHVAKVVKCTSCGMDEEKDAELSDIEKCHIRTAEVPAPMISHSFCSPELLEHIVYEKYCNAMPLYRLEKDFAAKGANISRTTMANWIIMAAKLWVKPVWEQMHSELVTSSVIYADETVVQVLNEPGRKAKTDSRMWVYCNGKVNDHSNILFEYRPTRNGDHASKFLGNYHGYLVCDGYDGYNKLKNVIRCDCWAHVRRKFVDALPSDKELLSTSAAAKGVEYCNRLFLLERKYNGEDEKGKRIAEPLTPDQHHIERQAYSKKVVDEFFAWAERLTVSGGTKLAKAVSYAMSEKKNLCWFLELGEIPIDNNRAENAVRPFCVGRKNWLFSASVKGAAASAMMYSVAATACANGMKLEEYLRSCSGVTLGLWYCPGEVNIRNRQSFRLAVFDSCGARVIWRVQPIPRLR